MSDGRYSGGCSGPRNPLTYQDNPPNARPNDNAERRHPSPARRPQHCLRVMGRGKGDTSHTAPGRVRAARHKSRDGAARKVFLFFSFL